MLKDTLNTGESSFKQDLQWKKKKTLEKVLIGHLVPIFKLLALFLLSAFKKADAIVYKHNGPMSFGISDSLTKFHFPGRR